MGPGNFVAHLSIDNIQLTMPASDPVDNSWQFHQLIPGGDLYFIIQFAFWPTGGFVNLKTVDTTRDTQWITHSSTPIGASTQSLDFEVTWTQSDAPATGGTWGVRYNADDAGWQQLSDVGPDGYAWNASARRIVQVFTNPHENTSVSLDIDRYDIEDPAPAPAVHVHGLFGDGMVLQRLIPVPVWGWADPGEPITVSFAGQTKAATADAHGEWRVTLDPMETESTPQSMTVSGNAGAVTLDDVLVGEVWVCSGQSNMEWLLYNTDDAAQAIAGATHPAVRLYTVPKRASTQPQTDLSSMWFRCAPATAMEFSAVAYYFGLELHESLGVPIGLIDSSVGGTAAEQWIPQSAFDAHTRTVQRHQPPRRGGLGDTETR